MKLLIRGNPVNVNRYIGFAKNKLAEMKSIMNSLGIPSDRRVFRIPGVNINISSSYGVDSIVMEGVDVCGCSAGFDVYIGVNVFPDGVPYPWVSLLPSDTRSELFQLFIASGTIGSFASFAYGYGYYNAAYNVYKGEVMFRFPSAIKCNHYMVMDYGETYPAFEIHAWQEGVTHPFYHPGEYTVKARQIDLLDAYMEKIGSLAVPQKENITDDVISNATLYVSQRKGNSLDEVNSDDWLFTDSFSNINPNVSSFLVRRELAEPRYLPPAVPIPPEQLGGWYKREYADLTMDIDLTGLVEADGIISLVVRFWSPSMYPTYFGLGYIYPYLYGSVAASIGGSLDRALYSRPYEYSRDSYSGIATGGGERPYLLFDLTPHIGTKLTGVRIYPVEGDTAMTVVGGFRVEWVRVYRDTFKYVCERRKTITIEE